eukprot:PITA_24036
MQPNPTTSPAIDPQQQRPEQQFMTIPLPPAQSGSAHQEPQDQPQLLIMPPFPRQVNSTDEIRTLWIGAAQMALQNYNGLPMPRVEEFYRLNWATYGSREKRAEEFTIFVGDLASDDTDELLQQTFRDKYPSVKGAKVITDKNTGRSKRYGFVTFGDENEQARAITEMNGKLCSSRPMRIGPAMRKQTPAYQQPSPKVDESASENDPNNTTLFVGGLDPTVSIETLTETFGQFGGLVYAKIPLGKRYGFFQFSNRASAELALQVLHGLVVGHRPLRVSWKRSPANEQVQHVQIQQPDLN